MEAAAIAHGHADHDEHHGPPAANRSLARRAPAARDAAFHHLRDHGLRGLLHGLLLHPGRERRPVVPVGGHDAAGRRRRRQHRILVSLVVHAALGGDGDQDGNRFGFKAGILSTFLLG